MTKRRCNWKTDLILTETFYERAEDGSLVPAAIPDESINFKIVYWTDQDSRRYTVERWAGVYKGCKKIDDNTLAVFLPLSRHFLGRGALCRELFLSIPDRNFEHSIRNICIPATTECLLWEGATDGKEGIKNDVIVAMMLNGIPKGGTAGQILTKRSDEDFDTAWTDNSLIRFCPRAELPETGEARVLYIDTASERIFRWDEASAAYRCVGWGINDGDEVILTAQEDGESPAPEIGIYILDGNADAETESAVIDGNANE